MKVFSYILIVLLVIGWAVGYFAWHTGSWIHLLLLAAFTLLVYRLIKQKGNVVKEK